MSFFSLFEGVIQLVPLAAQLTELLANLQKAQEKAKVELKEKLGQEIEIYPVILKTKEGTKIGVIVDLPGEIEGPLSALLGQAGVKFKAYNCLN